MTGREAPLLRLSLLCGVLLLVVGGSALLLYLNQSTARQSDAPARLSPTPQPLPEDLDRGDEEGRTPLMVACRDGRKELARRLVAAGAGVNLRSHKGFTALIYAASRGHSDLVELLLQYGAETDVRADGGYSALFYATLANSPESVQLLVAAGADVDIATDTGYTALMSATREELVPIVEVLLAAGADVNAESTGDTALRWAAEGGNLQIVQLLVEAGADLEATSHRGETAIDVAVSMGHHEVAHYLRNAGSRPPRVVEPDYQGHLEQGLTVVAFTPGGRHIVSGSIDGSLCFWRVDTGRPGRYLKVAGYRVESIAFSSDGSEMLTAAETTIKLWAAATGKVRLATREYAGSLYSAVFAGDGLHLASGSAGSEVQLWDRATGARVRTLQGHTGAVRAVATISSGEMLASAAEDGTVRLWDLSPGSGQDLLLRGHEGAVLCLAVSPDSRWLVSGGSDGATRLWSLADGKQHGFTSRCTTPVRSVAISPNGRQVANACEQGLVMIWWLASGVQVDKLIPGASLVSVAYSPDGRLLAVAGRDGRISLYETSTWERLRTISVDTLHAR